VQVYQLVRKLADEQAELENGGKRLSIAVVYDSIKRSNSSLKRRSKKLLEDSIERVLLVLKEEQDDSDSLDGDFDGIEDSPPVVKVAKFCTSRGMTRLTTN
jgi:ribosome biogenesis ATPase